MTAGEMQTAARSKSTADVLSALDALKSARAPETPVQFSTEATPYLVAAAVLHVFNPETLNPIGRKIDRSRVRRSLFEASVPAVGWRHKLYRSLKTDVRRQIFQRLTNRRELEAALDANQDREVTSLQELFERWVNGNKFNLLHLNFSQLENLELLRQWGIEDREGFPSAVAIAEARARRSGVALFEHLIDSAFVGRETELNALRRYIGVASPSAWDSVKGFFRREGGPEGSSAYALWGPGGVGKTAVIGKLLLDYVESPKGWFPFVYQPFDSETLDVLEPFTLIVAARDQLRAQIPNYPPDHKTSSSDDVVLRRFEKFDEIFLRYRRQRDHLSRRGSRKASRSDRLSISRSEEQELYEEFATLLESIASYHARDTSAGMTPVLWVLDTFEEVLYRTSEDLDPLWEMFSLLCARCKTLRLVISSRVQPPSISRLSMTIHELGDLDENDALKLLTALGIRDPQSTRAIVRQVGRNPLTLRLAARAAAEEEPKFSGFEGLHTRSLWLFKVAPELIRGQLYRRILDHIHDPDVRAMAHPGMILRRVTPDIIKDVLAPTCGLNVSSESDAMRLFFELRREHSLVRLDADASLRYRDEVRRPLLDLMTQDRRDMVMNLHRIAFNYYDNLEDTVSRAEAIYHGMMLDFAPRRLDRHWRAGVDRYLIGAIPEISANQQVWLASHMSIELPKDTERQADLRLWEKQVGRRALSGTRNSSPDRILKLLSERTERTPESPLYALEIRALMDVDKALDASQLALTAISQWPAVGNLGRLAELLWLGSQACAAIGDESNSIRMLDSLCDVALRFTEKLALVQGLTELVFRQRSVLRSSRDSLRLATQLNLPGTPPATAQSIGGTAAAMSTQKRLAAALDQLDSSQVDRERSLIRLAMVRLGPEYSETTARLVPWVLSDFTFVMSDHWSSLGQRIETIRSLLLSIKDEKTNDLATQLGSDPKVAGMQLFEGFMDLIKSGRRDPALIGALLAMLEAEETSLSGNTLAGIEMYRDAFEFDSSSDEVYA